MKNKGIAVCILLCIVLFGCGDKLDFRNRYTGEFMVVDSFVSPEYSSIYQTWVDSTQGEVFMGDDELVLLFEDQFLPHRAMVLTVDRKGRISGENGHSFNGNFQDKDHFQIVESLKVTWYTPDSVPAFLYHTGVRIDD